MKLDPDGKNYHQEMRALLATDLPEVEKITQAFAAITGQVAASIRRDIELASALGDQELKVKHQVRLETIETARRIFQACHRHVMGRRAWDEQDRR
jgi:hypothetical protein